MILVCLSIFFIFTAGTPFAGALEGPKPPICKGTLLSDRELQYDFLDRHISVIGWLHNSHFEDEKVAQAAYDIQRAANAGDCAKVTAIYNQAITDMSLVNRSIEATRTLSEIRKSWNRYQFRTLATELSPSELAEITKRSKVDTFDLAFEYAKSKCPDFNGSELHKIFPGPAFEFFKGHSKSVHLIAAEDDQIKAEALRQTQMENFDYDPNVFSPRTQKLLEHAPFTPDQEKELLSSETKPELKAKLGRILKSLKTMQTQISPRDAAIVKNLAKLDGNSLLLIGKMHLPDLKTKLDEACQLELDKFAKKASEFSNGLRQTNPPETSK